MGKGWLQVKVKEMANYSFALIIRFLAFFIPFLPYRVLRIISRWSVSLFLLFPSRAKRLTWTNLLRAGHKANWSFQKQQQIVFESFYNLVLTTLDYLYLWERDALIPWYIDFETPQDREIFISLLKAPRGAVFVSAHQANWELPFLLASYHAQKHHRRIYAIGRPIANKALYRWITTFRQRYGGIVIAPKDAMQECSTALERNELVGIVADQAFPSSSYSYPFFGTTAWSTTAPALLAKRYRVPFYPVFIRRCQGPRLQYRFRFGKGIDFGRDMVGIAEAMDSFYDQLQQSVMELPGQWLWQHNRWKQLQRDPIKRRYRFDFLIIVITEPSPIEQLGWLDPLLKLYHHSQIAFFLPHELTQAASQLEHIRQSHGVVKKESLQWEYHPFERLKETLPKEAVIGKQALFLFSSSRVDRSEIDGMLGPVSSSYILVKQSSWSLNGILHMVAELTP
jgi:KDO2-lipid IV(A) lauroyltransferase